MTNLTLWLSFFLSCVKLIPILYSPLKVEIAYERLLAWWALRLPQTRGSNPVFANFDLHIDCNYRKRETQSVLKIGPPRPLYYLFSNIYYKFYNR